MHIYGKYFIAILHLPLLHTSEICMLEHQLETFNTMSLEIPLWETIPDRLISLKNFSENFPKDQRVAFNTDDILLATLVITALQRLGTYFYLKLRSTNFSDVHQTNHILIYEKSIALSITSWPSTRDDTGREIATIDSIGRKDFSIILSQKPIPTNHLFLESANKRLHKMSLNYAIYLMPFKNDIPIIMFLLIAALEDDKNLRESIYRIEICIHEPDNSMRNKKSPLPTIALYVANENGAAQRLLDTLCKLFHKFSGIGIAPAWSKKVNSLIFWTQGPLEDKDNPSRQYLFAPDRVCYRADLTGKKVDYHLKLTACASK